MALFLSLALSAQDKVTKTVLELGRTDNRTMEHADYIARNIWHTEDDLYDKLIPEYMEHSAVVQAVMAYGLANLNHLLSREGLYKD